jgi:CubicO group peptidase (beta-lactamase class C family)
MFEKLDLLLDGYRPLFRLAYFAADQLRRIPGFGGQLTALRRKLLNPPAGLSMAHASAFGGLPGTPVNVDAILARIVGPSGCPGMAALVLRGDRIVSQGVAGLRKKGASERINLGDRFHPGSCTKAMNATLVAILIAEGRLSWTTTLDEIFGGMVPDMHPAWKNVTLPQVLAHRSGMIRDTGPKLRAKMASSGLSLPRQRREIVINVLSRPPTHNPGAKLVYSNTGYMLVGAALELITGSDWYDLVTERLFKPLGITTAGFGVPGTPGKVDQPWGHIPVFGTPVDPGSPFAEAPLFDIPAGLVHMTITDWAKFITLHLRGDAGNPHRQTSLLKPESFAKLDSPEPGERYGFGWIVENKEWAAGVQPGAAGRVLTHSGSNFRWHCAVSLAPEIDFAVLVVCNRGVGITALKKCGKAARALIEAFAPRPSFTGGSV